MPVPICPLKSACVTFLNSFSPGYSLNKDLHNVQPIYLLIVKRLARGCDEVA